MRNHLLPRFVAVFVIALFASAFGVEFEDEQQQAQPQEDPSSASRDFGIHSWHSGLFDFNGGSDFFWPDFNRPSFRDNVGSSYAGRKPPQVPETDHSGGNRDREPLDVEFVSGSIGKPGDTEVQLASRPEHVDPFPTFANPTSFFQNGFGSSLGFNNFFPFVFNNQDFKPWWKGDNVCVTREEDLEDWEKDSAISSTGFAGSFSVNFESCVDKPNKYVCTTISNHEGKKRTVTVTRQCCHGYGQAKGNGGYCEKMDLYNVEETSERLGAKEFINSIRKNGLSEKLSQNITIFVPLDAAFTDFSEQMFESNLVVLPLARNKRAANDISGITTKELELAHMVQGYVHIEDIENDQLLQSEYDNTTIRMNIFPKAPSDTTYEYRYRYTANCVPLVKINKQATNGLVHVVERVLTPVTQNLMEIIRGRSDMAVFKTVLEKTNLSELLEQEDKTFTIFAPSDSAFEKLDPSVRRTIKEGNSCAMNILKNHILDLTFCSVAVANKAKTNTFNMLGDKLNFERASEKSGDKQADETADLNEIKDILINNQSRIVETDIMGTNGVIHVVDTILPTESGVPITATLGKRNLNIFKGLIEASGLDEEFDVLSNVSFFAPTDKAFENSKWARELEANPESLKNNAELKKFLEYHVGLPYVKTCDLNEDMIKTKAGGELRINLYATHPVFSNVMNRATVNCARLIHFDDETCGAILHQVDKLLEPTTKSLMDLLEETPKYKKFLDLVKAANLTSLLDGTQDYTVMVPSNDVFNDQDDWYNRLLASKPELEKFIKTHILPDVLCCAGFVPSDWPFIRTIETIGGQNLRIDRTRRPMVGNAGIIKCDVVAKNGVLHEINDVIIVKENRRTSSIF